MFLDLRIHSERGTQAPTPKPTQKGGLPVRSSLFSITTRRALSRLRDARRHFFTWLRAAHKAYDDRDYLSGYTLARASMRATTSADDLRGGPKNHDVFA